jgi:hypothetical protein
MGGCAVVSVSLTTAPPALRPSHVDGSGAGDSGVARSTVSVDLETAAASLSGWLPTASELKPALDTMWPLTSLIPDLNAIIADFADVAAPFWKKSADLDCCELDRPCGELSRRLRLRLYPARSVHRSCELYLCRHCLTRRCSSASLCRML